MNRVHDPSPEMNKPITCILRHVREASVPGRLYKDSHTFDLCVSHQKLCPGSIERAYLCRFYQVYDSLISFDERINFGLSHAMRPTVIFYQQELL